MTNPSYEAARRAANIENEAMVSVTPPSGLFRGSRKSMREIWEYRELLWLLVRREVKARYKDSYLGIVWSLFRPLAQLFIYYFAIGQILGAARSLPDFAILVFIGLTWWGLFAEIVQSTTTSVIGNAGLVKKTYLPREIFPLAATGGALVNFVIQVAVLLVAIAVISSYRLSTDLLMAPVSMLIILCFGTAVGLILAAVNVYLRDVQHFVEVAIIILFWASPIVYGFTFVANALHGSWVEQIYLSNPVTISILGAQKALWSQGTLATGDLAQSWPPDLWPRLLITLLISVVLLWIGQRIFARLQGNFAQEL